MSPFTDAAISRSLAPLAAAVATAPSAAAKTQTKAPRSNGFFKSRTGVLVLAIFAAGTGYAIYSAKEDRIRGLNR